MIGGREDGKRNILDVIWDNHEEWTDEKIGVFVRRTLTEDITQEDLEKEINEGGE